MPDLLCGYRGRWHLVELKDPAQPPSGRTLTDQEAEWHARALLFAPVIVATTTEEIMEHLNTGVGK